MIFGRKGVDTSPNGVRVGSLIQACFEVLDRASELEALLRSNIYPLLNSEDLEAGQAPNGEEKFLREERRLRSFRRQLLYAELRVDASLHKVALVFGTQREQLEPLDGYFLTKLDRAISDHKDVSDLDSSDATRDLASNYLIKENRFPFGDLFDDRELRIFFGKIRNALGDLMRGLAQ
ncbi:hypothetical protein [Tabrizicola sp.]|uniref:hypothetical protein n=1 Tax=Tabrizicola sp. TaxID=2005166 RepID=UPI00262CD85B|nr:hypothetical protein [Tabrizicola sp.]MDM7932534.1 hypothetical protein [Tabrizicola sp.]